MLSLKPSAGAFIGWVSAQVQFDPRETPSNVASGMVVLGMRLFSEKALTRQRHNPCKPMEDSLVYAPDLGVFGVCDGGTREPFAEEHYPNPSPAAEGSQLFCKTAQHELSKVAKPGKNDLINALEIANCELEKLQKKLVPEINYYENDLIEVSGIFVLIRDKRMIMASLGDSPGYLIRSAASDTSRSQVINLNRPMTTNVMPLVEKLAKDIGLRQACINIRASIRNNPSAPERFGIFTGEKRCLELVEFKEFDLQGGDIILLTSDGIPPSTIKEHCQSRAEEIIYAAESCVDSAMGAIKEDDKAVIKIKLPD